MPHHLLYVTSFGYRHFWILHHVTVHGVTWVDLDRYAHRCVYVAMVLQIVWPTARYAAHRLRFPTFHTFVLDLRSFNLPVLFPDFTFTFYVHVAGVWLRYTILHWISHYRLRLFCAAAAFCVLPVVPFTHVCYVAVTLPIFMPGRFYVAVTHVYHGRYWDTPLRTTFLFPLTTTRDLRSLDSFTRSFTLRFPRLFTFYVTAHFIHFPRVPDSPVYVSLHFAFVTFTSFVTRAFDCVPETRLLRLDTIWRSPPFTVFGLRFRDLLHTFLPRYRFVVLCSTTHVFLPHLPVTLPH